MAMLSVDRGLAKRKVAAGGGCDVPESRQSVRRLRQEKMRKVK